MISKLTSNSGLVALRKIRNKIRYGDVLSYTERLINFEVEPFDWVDFSVEEEEVF